MNCNKNEVSKNMIQRRIRDLKKITLRKNTYLKAHNKTVMTKVGKDDDKWLSTIISNEKSKI